MLAIFYSADLAPAPLDFTILLLLQTAHLFYKKKVFCGSQAVCPDWFILVSCRFLSFLSQSL